MANPFDSLIPGNEQPTPQAGSSSNPFSSLIPPPPRSALGEVASQAKAGLYSGADIGGAALRDVGATDTGGAVSKWAQQGEAANAPQPEQHNAVTNFAGKAARMVGEFAPAVAGGALAAAAGAPAAVGAGLVALPYALGSQQQTYEKAKAAGQSEEEARSAGRWSGGVQGAAMMIPGIGGKLVEGVAGKALSKAAPDAMAAADLGAPGIAHAALRAAPETAGGVAGNYGMMVGSAAGQAEVEKEHGLGTQGGWEAAKEASMPSSAAALAFGVLHAIHGAKPVADGDVKPESITRALGNGDAHPQARQRAAGIVYNSLMTGNKERGQAPNPDGAATWRMNAEAAINQGKPIDMSSAWFESLHPSVFPRIGQATVEGELNPEGGTPPPNAGAPPGSPPGAPPPAGGQTFEGEATEVPEAQTGIPLLPAPRGPLEAAARAGPTGGSEGANLGQPAPEGLESSGPLGAAAAAGHESGAVGVKTAQAQAETDAQDAQAKQDAFEAKAKEGEDWAKTAAKDTSPSGVNIRAALRNEEPMSAEQAQQAAAQQGAGNWVAVRHPEGTGYGIIPSTMVDPKVVQEHQAFMQREQGENHALAEQSTGPVGAQPGGTGGLGGPIEGGGVGRGNAEGQPSQQAGPQAEAPADRGAVPSEIAHFPAAPVFKAPHSIDERLFGASVPTQEEANVLNGALTENGELHPMFRGAAVHSGDLPDSAVGVFNPVTDGITLDRSLIWAAGQDSAVGRQVLRMNAHHEVTHYASYDPVTYTYAEDSHPAFAITGFPSDANGGLGRQATGGIIKEVLGLLKKDPNSDLAKWFMYPFADWKKSPETLGFDSEREVHEYFARETLAQLAGAYQTMAPEMAKKLPLGHALIERIHDEVKLRPNDGPRSGLREAIRALGPDGKLQPNAAGVPGRGDTNASNAAGAVQQHPSPSMARSKQKAQLDSGIRAGVGASTAGRSLVGLPKSSPGPHAPAQQAAESYMASAGMPYRPPRTFVKVDPAKGKEIAAAYDKMKHAPDAPAVKKAYAALEKETIAQWHAMMASGIKVDFSGPDNPYPYKLPHDAVNDARNNNHLTVYSTDEGFGKAGEDTSGNPLLKKSGIVHNGKELLVNDVFRAVHDYFGHVKEGVGFRADGEENAWRSHASMFSDQARKAMTSETRGQNSWLNWGPHGEKNRTASQEDTVYAHQKTGLLPDKYTRDPYHATETAISIREDGPPKGSLPSNPTVADVAKLLNAAAPDRSYDNEADVADATKQLHAEIAYQLSQPRSGLGWYTGDVGKAWRFAAMEHPDLASDPVKRQLASIATAIMSPGVRAKSNFRDGLVNWDHYEKNGEFSPVQNPDTGNYWSGKPARGKALAHLNSMLKDRGEQGTVEWLLTEHPKRMLDAEKSRYAIYKGDANVLGGKDSMHYGSEMFGPKVGPFVLDMNGMKTGKSTVDVWATRTVRRLFGKLPTEARANGQLDEMPTTKERALITKMFHDAAENPALKALGIKDAGDAQGVAWFFEQQLYDKMIPGTESGFFSDGARDYVESKGHTVGDEGAGAPEATPATIPTRPSEDAANAELRTRAPDEPAGREPGADESERGIGPTPKPQFSKAGSYHLYEGVAKEDRPKQSFWDALKAIFTPGSRGPQAILQKGIEREGLARMEADNAKAEQTFKKFAKLFSRMSVDQARAFTAAYERGQRQASAALQAVADALKADSAAMLERLQAQGKFTGPDGIENYLGRIWKNDPASVAQAFARRPMEGGKGFLKQRYYEYQSDGLEAGLTPVTENPIEMFLLKRAEQNKWLYAHDIFNEMKSRGVTQEVEHGGRKPDGWVPLNDSIAFSPNGKYYAPEAVARIFNNHLSPGLRGNGVFDTVRQAGNILNSAQLGFSLFHVGFEVMESMISKTALGIQQLSRGQFLSGGANVLRGLNPTEVLFTYMRGDKLMRQMLGQLNDPGLAPIVQALLHGGGRGTAPEFYKNQTINAFRNAIKTRDWKGAITGFIPHVIDRINAPIFEKFVPRQKLGVFFDMAKDWLERNPSATLEEKREAMGKFWDSVDNRMGLMTYDNVFWNRTLKDLLHVSVRSVGWNWGTFRELGGGVADLADVRKNKELSSRTAYVLALPFITGMMGAVINYMYTGQGPQETKDYFFPRTGRTRPDGSPDRVSLPTYMKDVYEYMHDATNFAKYGGNPAKTLVNKMNPMLGTVVQMLTNQDFFGGAIRSIGDTPVQQLQDEAEYLAGQIEPFSMRNYVQQAKTAKEEPSVAGYLGQNPAMFGVTPSPGYITKSDAQQESIGISSQRDATMQKFTELLRDGDITPQEAITRMRAAGLKLNEMHQVVKRGLQTSQPQHLRHLGEASPAS